MRGPWRYRRSALAQNGPYRPRPTSLPTAGMLPAGVPCFFPLPACERRSPRRESRRYNVTVLVRFLLLPESTLFFAGGLAELFNRIALFSVLFTRRRPLRERKERRTFEISRMQGDECPK